MFHHKTQHAHLLLPYLPKAPTPISSFLDLVTTPTHITQLPTMQSPTVKAFRLHSGPNTLLSTLFSDTLSMTHQASYHTKKAGKCIFLHILTFTNFWTANWKTRGTAETESKYKVTIVGPFIYIFDVSEHHYWYLVSEQHYWYLLSEHHYWYLSIMLDFWNI